MTSDVRGVAPWLDERVEAEELRALWRRVLGMDGNMLTRDILWILTGRDALDPPASLDELRAVRRRAESWFGDLHPYAKRHILEGGWAGADYGSRKEWLSEDEVREIEGRS